MVKGNLQIQSTSSQPFFRVPENSRIFAEMFVLSVYQLISFFGGPFSAKRHGLALVAPRGLLNPNPRSKSRNASRSPLPTPQYILKQQHYGDEDVEK